MFIAGIREPQNQDISGCFLNGPNSETFDKAERCGSYGVCIDTHMEYN